VDLVEAGDLIVVPSNAPHTVEVLSEAARLIDCFYPIREDFL
jgi:quercetin dioxygenase-like cupin family protein